MTISVKHVNQLKSAFFYAVEAGTPEKIFSDEIKSLLPKDKELKVLSVGKAASSMAEKMIDLKIRFYWFDLKMSMNMEYMQQKAKIAKNFC